MKRLIPAEGLELLQGPEGQMDTQKALNNVGAVRGTKPSPRRWEGKMEQ